MVGLIPLFAVETLEPELLDRLPGFQRRLEWFIDNRPDLTQNVACMRTAGRGERRLLSIVDANEVAPHPAIDAGRNGVSLSARHSQRLPLSPRAPYVLNVNGAEHRVDYDPAESRTGLFGGNSNWRGPVWFPLNYLLIESLQKFHHYFGDEFKVECPTGSGRYMTLWEVAQELSQPAEPHLPARPRGTAAGVWRVGEVPDRPALARSVLFYEYFHGDTGRGVGASHQTGWTGLVAKMLQQSGERKSVTISAAQAATR